MRQCQPSLTDIVWDWPGFIFRGSEWCHQNSCTAYFSNQKSPVRALGLGFSYGSCAKPNIFLFIRPDQLVSVLKVSKMIKVTWGESQSSHYLMTWNKKMNDKCILLYCSTFKLNEQIKPLAAMLPSKGQLKGNTLIYIERTCRWQILSLFWNKYRLN